MSAYITQRLKAAWALYRGNRLDEAADMVGKLLKSDPGHCEANTLMAEVQLYRNYVYRAVAYAQAAVKSGPDNVGARQTLVKTLTAAGERRTALVHIRRLLEMNAGDAELAMTHAATLRDLLRYDEAVALYREAIARYPSNLLLPALLPFSMEYAPGATPEEIFAAHTQFGASVDRKAPPVTRRFRNAPDPARTLRVGVISADLYAHSVMYYFDSVLEHADPARLRFVAYQTRNPGTDAMTARLRQRFGAWRDAINDTPGGVAEKMIEDQIDIALDLNGLTTTLKGLEIMNNAPAPVTVTYCGYPDTTGVRSVRYRLVDSITDPPGAETFAVEELARLDPCFLCYTPVRDAPPVNPEQPLARNGFVTFGSFNSIQKLNDAVIAAWSRIVNAVPGSRLLLKHQRLREPTLREELLERFAGAGLAQDRLEFLEKNEKTVEHLRMYERLDVSLDPFPYNGTTTTCEATVQGVPTVTLRGNRHASRVGASLLTTLGTPELIAENVDGYVAVAAALGTDRERLAAYRGSLRERLLASPLCDGPAFARRFESALRLMWERWCRAADGPTGATERS